MNKRATILLCFAGPAIAVAACGGNSTNNVAECSAGTSPANGVCVAPESGVSDSAAPADGGMVLNDADATAEPPDTGNAPTDGSAPSDVVTHETGAESGPDQPSDPCPTGPGIIIDCDPICCAADPACADAGLPPECAASCTTGTVALPQPNSDGRIVVRTPANPGVDPQCAHNCGDDAAASNYVFGLGFTIPSMLGPDYLITVDPPWQLVVQAYCPESPFLNPGGCVTTAGRGITIAVMTTDAHAPARNVVFQTTQTLEGCPIDGGP